MFKPHKEGFLHDTFIFLSPCKPQFAFFQGHLSHPKILPITLVLKCLFEPPYTALFFTQYAIAFEVKLLAGYLQLQTTDILL